MAGTVGRPNPLFGWSTYDWAQKLKYTITSFAALTWAQTQTTAVATVVIAGPSAPGSQVGVLYGTGQGSGGYDRKTRLVPGPSAAITLRELKAGTVYHTAAYGIGGDGTPWVGPNTLLTTSP